MRLFAPLCLALCLPLACSGGASEESPLPSDGEVTETTAVSDSASSDTPSGETAASDGAPSDAPTDAPVDAAPVPGATEPNLKVAFVGDQGTNANTLTVLNLIKKEGAQFVILLGDFDYEDDPAQWEGDLVAGLGADFPVFGAVGNHDELKWAVADGYKARLTARLAKITGPSAPANTA